MAKMTDDTLTALLEALRRSASGSEISVSCANLAELVEETLAARARLVELSDRVASSHRFGSALNDESMARKELIDAHAADIAGLKRALCEACTIANDWTVADAAGLHFIADVPEHDLERLGELADLADPDDAFDARYAHANGYCGADCALCVRKG